MGSLGVDQFQSPDGEREREQCVDHVFSGTAYARSYDVCTLVASTNMIKGYDYVCADRSGLLDEPNLEMGTFHAHHHPALPNRSGLFR